MKKLQRRRARFFRMLFTLCFLKFIFVTKYVHLPVLLNLLHGQAVYTKQRKESFVNIKSKRVIVFVYFQSISYTLIFDRLGLQFVMFSMIVSEIWTN